MNAQADLSFVVCISIKMFSFMVARLVVQIKALILLLNNHDTIKVKRTERWKREAMTNTVISTND